jgi:hypothetical protein
MKKILVGLIFLPLMLFVGCDSGHEVICTTQAVAGLNVLVKDAASNELLSEGITVLAQEGEYTETLQLLLFDLQQVFVGAWERKGTYTITVSKAGYQTFTSSPIVVERDICHVIPKHLTVYLQAD